MVPRMILHGTTLVFLGNDPNKFTLQATPIFNDSAQHDWLDLSRDRFSLHEGRGFEIDEIDVYSPESVNHAFARTVELIKFLDQQQKKDVCVQKSQPLVFGVGKVSGTQYNIRQFFDTLHLSLKQQSKSKAYKSLRNTIEILKNSICHESDYKIFIPAEHVTDEMITEFEETDLNQELVQIKAEFDRQDFSGLNNLIELAEAKAKVVAERLIKENPGNHVLDFYTESVAIKDFPQRPDLIRRLAFYDFLTWSPDIHKAFVNTLRVELGIKGNIYVSPGSAPNKPYFSSVTAAIIQNRQDIAAGNLAAEDVAYQNNLLPDLKWALNELTLSP